MALAHHHIRWCLQQAGAVAIPGADKAQNGASAVASGSGAGTATSAAQPQRQLPAPAFGSSPNLQALALDAATEPSFEPRTFQEITVVSADQPKLLSRLSEVMVRRVHAACVVLCKCHTTSLPHTCACAERRCRRTGLARFCVVASARNLRPSVGAVLYGRSTGAARVGFRAALTEWCPDMPAVWHACQGATLCLRACIRPLTRPLAHDLKCALPQCRTHAPLLFTHAACVHAARGFRHKRPTSPSSRVDP